MSPLFKRTKTGLQLYAQMHPTLRSVTLTVTSGRSWALHSIPRIESSIGCHSLGVRAAPDGTFHQEFQFRYDQAIKWVANISKAPLTCTEVFTAFCAMWSPAIDYPLAVTSFSREQCSTHQRVYSGVFLIKMGLAHTTSRAIIFAPRIQA